MLYILEHMWVVTLMNVLVLVHVLYGVMLTIMLSINISVLSITSLTLPLPGSEAISSALCLALQEISISAFLISTVTQIAILSSSLFLLLISSQPYHFLCLKKASLSI